MRTAEQLIAVVEDSDEDYGAFLRVFSTIAPVRRWERGEMLLDQLESGEFALSDFAVLFVDLRLPGIDGVEVVRRLRALPGGDAATVIVMSSSEFEVDIVRALDAGVDEYEVKPRSVAELRAIAARTVERIGARGASSPGSAWVAATPRQDVGPADGSVR